MHNDLGDGYRESVYQRALGKAFTDKGLCFAEQVYYPLIYKEQNIGKQFLDFLVENKVIVEIKKGDRYAKRHIEQVVQYLHLSKMKLAILINFGKNKIEFKRLVNIT